MRLPIDSRSPISYEIIILGAGPWGESVADSLVSERNDITVIDTDAERLRDLQARFDLRGVVGSGIEPAVLAEAGARDTDLLIACAAQDETNLVCCKIWRSCCSTSPTRIARVRSLGFQCDTRLLGADGFAVDRIICPEVPHALHRQLVEYPEAYGCASLPAGKESKLVSVRARAGAHGEPHHCRAACQRPVCACGWSPSATFLDRPTVLSPALAAPASSRATRCLMLPRRTTLRMLSFLHRRDANNAPCAAS